MDDDARPAEPPGDPGGAGFWAAVGIRPFRRLWLVLGLSSLGDWLGLLAGAAFASAQVSAPAAQGAAFGTVIAVQLLPALILGPVAGVAADRLDRRMTMAAMDAARFLLFLSIPVGGLVLGSPEMVVAWTAVALFLAQTAALVWTPAKEAAVPNLLPHGLLETANRLTLVTTYGLTPVAAALVFAAISRLPQWGRVTPAHLALAFDALTFLASAAVVYLGIPEISGRVGRPDGAPTGLVRQLAEGARFITGTPLARGLVIGVLGAFAGAGVVIGTARFYAASLGGGDATFGVLFAALFAGFGVGTLAGPGVVGRLSRRRWFGLSIILAGAAVAGLAFAPRLAIAAGCAVVVGAGAGMAFLSGITLLGGEVDDAVRGRVFAFLQTAVRVTLLLTVAACGVIVGVGASRRLHVGPIDLHVSASRVMLAIAGVAGVAIGVLALRQIDDRPGVPVLADLARSVLRLPDRSDRDS
ncbi:MFS transporter [Hamadaea tsunoensis]|uniref:MFS transporter n=1 Tax=Hamadaea tsunoensis TaxID=53368 RepID=UPI0003FFBB74|nr:MFS transporter [Hamadaea tsunoensis]